MWCVQQLTHLRYIVIVWIEMIKTQHFWIKNLGGNNVLNMPELLCIALLVHAVEHHVLCSECGICWVYVALQVGPSMVGKESHRGSVQLLPVDWRIQLRSSLFDWDMHAIHELLWCYVLWTPQFLVVTSADVFKPWCVVKYRREFSRIMFKPTTRFIKLLLYSNSDYLMSVFICL
jgi:hypothetical protein